MACYSPWGCKELDIIVMEQQGTLKKNSEPQGTRKELDMTEQLNNNSTMNSILSLQTLNAIQYSSLKM